MACTKASLRLLSGESYPTSVRTMGLGLGDMGANSAGLLTPQAAYLGSRMYYVLNIYNFENFSELMFKKLC